MKLTLCLINQAPRHEIIWRSGGIAAPVLTSALDEGEGQLLATEVLHPGKEPAVPIGNVAWWAPESV
jgi:hypothetical protein